MSTILITKFKNKAEASRAAKILKAQKGLSVETRIEEIEDMYLSRLIDEGMKEEGEVDTDEFLDELNRRIAKKD